MVTRATSAERNPPAVTHDREVGAQPAKCDFVGVKVHPSTHGVDNRFWLLVDLLLHESIEFALHDRGNLKLERLNAPHGGDLAGGLVTFFLTAETVDVEFTLSDVGDVIIFEIEDEFGVLDYSGRVKNPMGCGRPSSDMKARDCVWRTFELTFQGASNGEGSRGTNFSLC